MRTALAAVIGMAILPAICCAGPKREHPLHADVASLELPTITLVNNSVTVDRATADSAEVEADLPEAPDSTAMPLTLSAPDSPALDNSNPLTVQTPELAGPVSPLLSMPLVPVAMRLGGHNFNTDDGSSLNAFAICYRLNKRSSVQVIPGDPAPVKLPVATMANNMGVTVGMVYRLSKRR